MLGPYNYRDWNYSAKFEEDSRIRRMFNDDEQEKPSHEREHLLHLQIEGIFLTSEAIPGPELRKWKGERSICNQKNKKRMSFIGREEILTYFPKFIVSGLNCFKGRIAIPTREYPAPHFALWPLNATNRTIFG